MLSTEIASRGVGIPVHFRCSRCGGRLAAATSVARDSQDGPGAGSLGCTVCGATFRVVNHVPRFVEGALYADSFGFQWNTHCKTQLDSHSGLPLSKNRLLQVSGWDADLGGRVILESGSGAGRFTEVLLQAGAEVYSFDLSSAVEANFANNGDEPRLHLFQADIFNLPLAREVFDGVLCLGVLQHTPDPGKALQALCAYVRPGGSLVVDCYANNWKSMLHWKYILRPVTKRMDRRALYRIIELAVPVLLPLAIVLRKIGGRAGGRLIPILQYAHWGLPYELNKQWAILDTFDMYSPQFDKPQSLATVRSWFERAGFQEIVVQYGPNGVIGRGVKPRTS